MVGRAQTIENRLRAGDAGKVGRAYSDQLADLRARPNYRCYSTGIESRYWLQRFQVR